LFSALGEALGVLGHDKLQRLVGSDDVDHFRGVGDVIAELLLVG